MPLTFQRHFLVTLSSALFLPPSKRDVKDACPESRLIAILVDEDTVFWAAQVFS